MNAYSLSAISAKQDETARENFIRDSHSFLVMSILLITHKFTNDQEDVFCVAQMALNEAIDSYHPDQGEFKTLANVIIKRRIIDFLRSQEKFKNELPAAPDNLNGVTFDYDDLNSLDPEIDFNVINCANQTAIRAFQDNERQKMLAIEIKEAQELLGKYGFTFFDITDASPKSEKTREACKIAIITLLKPGQLYEEMRSTGKVPIGELEKACGVKRKILERHRRYIIASAEILAGDFPLLSDYLDYIRKELRG